MIDLKKYFCTRPFEWLEIQSGKAYFCCPGWLKTRGVPWSRDMTVHQVWNSPVARDFRASILDGSFRYCIKNECPFMNEVNVLCWEKDGPPLKEKSRIVASRLRRIIEKQLVILDDGPKTLNCGYDRTCNLACPSCRSEVVGLKGPDIENQLAFQCRVFDQVKQGLSLLYVTGAGDPFASVVYRNLLRGLSANDFPQMDVHLGTNALLWTSANWEAMRDIQPSVKTARISIDAATPQTYALNRPGGDWETLMKNLEFVAGLRRNGPLRFVALSFVVQQNNYREMPAFIDLVERFGFDQAYFQKFVDWGSTSPQEARKRAIRDYCHPEHHVFLKVLCDPSLDKAVVSLHSLCSARRKALLIKRLFGPAGFVVLGALRPPLLVYERFRRSLKAALVACGLRQ